jgi:cell division protein FtsZ
MCFIAAGMGGGTGTGAAPVIAQAAREMNILTVGVVTKPFLFEGSRRMRSAESGIAELQQHVDTLIVIPNQNLFLVANPNTTFKEAFLLADEVLQQGVRGITDLMVMPGLINLDFADVRSVMHEMGKAMMGTGEAEGDGRALEAAERAIANPLLDGVSMQGAKGVIVSITGGEDMRLMEVDEAANHIRELVDPDANIIWGSAFNENLNGKIRVSVVATGIDNDGLAASPAPQARTPFSFSRPAPEPVAVTPAPTASLFESTDSAPVEEPSAAAEPETEAEDDSLILGSDFEAPEADDEAPEANEASEEKLPESNGFPSTSWAGADALELNTPADANPPSPAPVDVAQAPERAAPRLPTGGTLFERMSNLSRGLSRSDDENDKGDGGASSTSVPRFLDRQNNS